MKRAVVTGGGGYVGGRLCAKLCEKGYAVTALDVHFLAEEGQQVQLKRVKVGWKHGRFGTHELESVSGS